MGISFRKMASEYIARDTGLIYLSSTKVGVGQEAEGSSAVADLVFQFRANLAKRLVITLWLKNWVITEAEFAPRWPNKLSMHFTFVCVTGIVWPGE